MSGARAPPPLLWPVHVNMQAAHPVIHSYRGGGTVWRVLLCMEYPSLPLSLPSAVACAGRGAWLSLYTEPRTLSYTATEKGGLCVG